MNYRLTELKVLLFLLLLSAVAANARCMMKKTMKTGVRTNSSFKDICQV